MEYPVKVALARAVPVLPTGAGWWFEPKFDGHRTVLRRTEDAVTLHARSGRVVTSHWTDLAVPAMRLRPGTTLDGEAVVWRDGRLGFGAVQARAASSLERARALAARHPASYAAWDILEHPDRGPGAFIRAHLHQWPSFAGRGPIDDSLRPGCGCTWQCPPYTRSGKRVEIVSTDTAMPSAGYPGATRP